MGKVNPPKQFKFPRLFERVPIELIKVEVRKEGGSGLGLAHL